MQLLITACYTRKTTKKEKPDKFPTMFVTTRDLVIAVKGSTF